MNIRFLLSRAGLILKKYSPEILTGLGLVSQGVGTFLACKATYTLDEVVKDDKDAIQKIKDAHEGKVELAEGAEYTEAMYKKDMTTAKVNMAKKVVKHYLPAGLCLVGGGASILAGHGILSKRNAVTAATLSAVAESYSKYRQNVKEAARLAGQDPELVDRVYRLGERVVKEEVERTDEETGEVTVESQEKPIFNLEDIVDSDPNVVWFSYETCPETFTGNVLMDLNFLKLRQSDMTSKLRLGGHLLKNDVQRSIGHKITDDGMILGWVTYGDGDNYVDFGIFDEEGQPLPWVLDYYAQHEKIPLTLNMDGIIFGKLKIKGNAEG